MSAAEDRLALALTAAGLGPFERQVACIPGRRFRMDFVWPAARLICEVQGQVWTKGGHTSGQGYTDDCEKQALAVLAGWRYLRVTTGQVRNGQALGWIAQALQGGEDVKS